LQVGGVMSVLLHPARLAVFVLALLAASTGPPDIAREALPPPGPRTAAPPRGALFVDDFSSGSLARWEADRDGVWTVRRGMLRADLPDAKQERAFLYAGSEDWEDYAVDLDICAMRGSDKGVVVRVEGGSGVGVDLRGPGYQDVLLYRREWPLGRARVPNANGAWNHLRVEARGNRFRVLVNGSFAVEGRDYRNARPRGRIALPAYTGGIGACTVYYDNVLVTPLD
jgi:hypothetical protein